MQNKIKRLLLSFIILSIIAGNNINAEKTIHQARIYINPGHGGWGSNDRPLPTINHALMDTLGFFETNTNLIKAISLRDELEKAGAGYVKISRTRNGIIGKESDRWQDTDILENSSQLITLSVIARDVIENNMDYFLSIHSNATTYDSTLVNYPLLLYRGTDFNVGNGLFDTREMAFDAWKYIADNQISYYSHYNLPTLRNVRGDISFMGSSSTVNGYTGYYAVLKHGCDGFLSEGCFHTYQPERHRLLNKDYCKQEGVRYSRAIRAWFDDFTETKGCIMGTVKDLDRALINKLYKYKTNSMDAHYPLNHVKVVLQNKQGTEISSYTTDGEYNGVFVFTGLEPDTYKLYFDVPGYKKGTAEIQVSANKTSFINSRLTNLMEYEGVRDLKVTINFNQVTLNWDVPQSPHIEIVRYNVYRDDIFRGDALQTNFIEKDLDNGVHTYSVYPVYADNTKGKITSTAINIQMSCGPVTYLSADHMGSEVTLSWDNPKGIHAEAKFNIYHNDQVIATVNEKFYGPVQCGGIECVYAVTAVYGNYETEQITVSVNPSNLSSMLYPNPANGYITIESVDFITSIKILDLNGRIQHAVFNLNSKKETIDITGLLPGVYIIKINNTFKHKLLIKAQE